MPFLKKMLYEAAYWRPNGPRPPFEKALSCPELNKILDGWGREGDTAVIAATRIGVYVGAAWYRYWTMESHSYGFVDEETPELGLAVRREFRGRGYGTRLLQELIQQARASKAKAISLSVEPDNLV